MKCSQCSIQFLTLPVTVCDDSCNSLDLELVVMFGLPTHSLFLILPVDSYVLRIHKLVIFAFAPLLCEIQLKKIQFITIFIGLINYLCTIELILLCYFLISQLYKIFEKMNIQSLVKESIVGEDGNLLCTLHIKTYWLVSTIKS